MIRYVVLLAVMLAAHLAPAAAQPALAEKRIALTFDDAPRGAGPVFSGAERASTLIAALAEAKTGPVAFFVTTRGMDEAEGRERIARYAAAGHLIANHTRSHPWAHQTEVEAYVADIDAAERQLEGFANRRPWFRFPYLDEGRAVEKRDALAAALAARGLMNGYVTVDDFDWHLERRWAEAVAQGRPVDREKLRKLYVDMLMDAVRFFDEAAVAALGRSPVHTLLLHENDVGALFIGDLVAALRAEGWTIVSPDEAYADPIAAMIPKTLFTGQGRVAALAADAGRSPRDFAGWFSNEMRIDQEILRRGVFRAPD